MRCFDSDYMEGAHPAIIERLAATNLEQTGGYGGDAYCDSAKEKIKKACGIPDAEVYFLVGGTQTNSTVIAAALRPYEGVVSADTGHINVHEAGAIEASGHKILPLPNYNGKISPEDLKNFMEGFYKDDTWEHMAAPGMVYISHPTEYGTLYTKEELKSIREICDQYDIPLFMDGARLGYGLMANNTDVDLKTIAEYCHVFYIGGTKVGALFGEAVVVTKPGLLPHFFTVIKQKGGLLAKGRLLGLQFDTLFTDDLYFKIAKNAIDMAEKLKVVLKEKGYEFFLETDTNQQFVVLENVKMKELAEKVSFGFWENIDADHTVVRFATSWATTEEAIDELASLI